MPRRRVCYLHRRPNRSCPPKIAPRLSELPRLSDLYLSNWTPQSSQTRTNLRMIGPGFLKIASRGHQSSTTSINRKCWKKSKSWGIKKKRRLSCRPDSVSVISRSTNLAENNSRLYKQTRKGRLIRLISCWINHSRTVTLAWLYGVVVATQMEPLSKQVGHLLATEIWNSLRIHLSGATYEKKVPKSRRAQMVAVIVWLITANYRPSVCKGW